MTTILFDSTRTHKTNRPFGLGLGRTQTERLPQGPSDADRQWAAQNLNADARDYCLACESAPAIGVSAAELDVQAAVSATLGRMERGLGIIPADLAELVMSRSIIGHPAGEL